MGRVFTYGLGDQGSILGRVVPKIQNIILDAALLNTQHYKIRIKRDFGSTSISDVNFTYLQFVVDFYSNTKENKQTKKNKK